MITMATEDDVLRTRGDRYAWFYDQDRPTRPIYPIEEEYRAAYRAEEEDRRRRSSAVRHATAVQEDQQAAAQARNEVLDKLQAKRRQREAERAKTAGLTTAEILAATARRS